MKAILYYVHDPMCSWCWGFSRVLAELIDNLPKEVEVHRLLGGLAPDSDLPMPDTMQQQIKSSWSHIEETIPGVKFNFNFWDKNSPRRSTYPACRAVIAARKQGEEFDIKMTKAIQQAYYQDARNPSDNSTLIDLAKEIGLVVSDFKKDLSDKNTQDELMMEIHLSRELYAESFPSLILKTEYEIFSIKVNYSESDVMLKSILEKI